MRTDSLLLRYLEEKDFVDMFMAGEIRMNSLGFFRGNHDEPSKIGQIDRYEGLTCPVGARSTDDCRVTDRYQYCNLLCCHRLNYYEDGETLGWYLDETMNHFGDYVVIIKNRDEFQRRLVRAASEAGFKCGCNVVDYSSRVSADRDVFDKEKMYAYQNEWRAALYRETDECEPCILSIGPINDIAEWCRTRDLQQHLYKIFHNRDFIGSQDQYYGNIDRKQFAQLFHEWDSTSLKGGRL